ncbi:hypothetical protein [Gloeobacter kilaueensis]|uniref:Uncharacterized protein n=1 Tax=Gloeobacter kilaueensis (strain ATCC BAA-2537 / CCAP 1431/1 / ULC 316 / JS1) TaxID=1183438 RepID=U5QFG4_GLOK1|nr:hypothetical protein [Gloeobacter kilaueensis]AGY57623.1 hypothetical protein GKIL_1377 [Gloeobacter kilaueensis JS1]
MGLRYLGLPLLLALVVSCGSSGGEVEVTTPLQGQITVSSERDAQKASRALLRKIDESVEQLQKIDQQMKLAVGPTKKAEREALLSEKKDLDDTIRKELSEFLAYYPKVEAKGWQLQPFDEARYFYYSYRYKDLMPKA